MWNKKGIVIKPDPNLWWNKTHGMLPTPMHIKDNMYKVYYSGRDANNVSHIGYSIVDVSDGIIREISKSPNPILSPGERGCFDDNGVTPSCFIDDKLYYIGWNSGTTTYRMSLIMGLAELDSSGSYNRTSRAPLLPKTNLEPFGICTAPFVMFDDTLNIYKMWYVSGEGWISRDLPKYNIKYAESVDGIHWQRDGVVSVELYDTETALARPIVLKTEDGYEMYFSYKDPNFGYRIGYATSPDGQQFNRVENTIHSMSTSKSSWDSDMVEYGYVFSHRDIKYMLYNGNDYGFNGIGYAVFE